MSGFIISAGDTIYRKFTTVGFNGIPTTLAGTPVVSVYKNGLTAESTAGVTLTVDFDGRTGLNHVAIDTSADATFYADGNHYDIVVTTGTVNGNSLVGYKVGDFDLSALATDIATAVWSAGTRTLTAIADSTGITTLLTRIAQAILFDGSGYVKSAPQTSVTLAANQDVRNVTGSVSGSVGSVTGSVGSVSGDVGGDVIGSVGSVVADVGITQTAADKVWTSAARTLTSYGTLVADVVSGVWSAGTRTLTSLGTVVADVWSAGVRTLTASLDPTAAQIRTELDSNSTKLANLDATVSSRVKPADTLAAVTNVVNDVGITQAGADKVWTSAVRTLTSFGTLVTDVASAVSTAIWTAGSRTLTAFGFTVNTNANTTETNTLAAVVAVNSNLAVLETEVLAVGDAVAAIPTPPTAAAIRAEIDSNSTQLAAILAKATSIYGLTGNCSVMCNTNYVAGKLHTYDVRIYDTPEHASLNDPGTGLLELYHVTNEFGVSGITESTMVPD